MSGSISNIKGKNILDRISLDDFIVAVTALGDRVNDLQHESWRLSKNREFSFSLWDEIIDKLKLDHDERTRHALYNLFRSKRNNICQFLEENKKFNNAVDTNAVDCEVKEGQCSFPIDDKNRTLASEPSFPLYDQPNTRAYQKASRSGNIYQHHCMRTDFISLTRIEWKDVYSRTNKKAKPGWANIFDEKLKLIGNTCSLRFHSANIPTGIRKHNCSDFWFSTVCTGDICQRKYIVSHRKDVDDNVLAIFRVDVYGEENHNETNVMRTRKINGEQRDAVGKRANEIGPTATFRELVESADEKLLAAGNFSQCPTIEAVKKCAVDYRKKMRFDEDIFRECRILCHFYCKEDVTSEKILGYIHNLGENPFRLHLFTELQLRRYIKYIENEKYSFIHIDSTGAVLKPMKEQNQSLIYTIMFKDGNDAIDNVPLAHAILTDHTVPSIGYFLGNVIHSVNQVTAKKIHPPSFVIIDFSAALMNAVLQQFNIESVNKHLKRCWNVIHGKYNAEKIRTSTFIHLCCCHAMHAFARSLNAEKIEKKTREAVLYIFAYMICANDINQLYDTFGLVINIFGDPYNENAKTKLDQICSLKLNVDEESESVLKDFDNIFKTADKDDDELKLVDEYFDSDEPIIHQSPFNKEAIKRYPTLDEIVIKKAIKTGKQNNLFSASIVRIFYRWWAYLPLWTGLLFNFEERYANDLQQSLSVTYYPVRYSNAVIESYFRTFKKSICQGKRGKAPQEVIMALHRSVKVQSRTDQFRLTQSSKGRKRKKGNIGIVEKWKKRTHEKIRRSKYTNLIDKFASKRLQHKEDQSQPNGVTKSYSKSENATTPSSSKESKSSSKASSEKLSINIRDSLSSSDVDHKIIHENYTDIPADLGANTNNNLQTNEVSNKRTNDNLSNGLCIKISYNPEIIINDFKLKWPRFEIQNFVFEGQAYSLQNTCAVDSALFCIYFIYVTDEIISSEFKVATEPSPYAILVKTFDVVNKQGWDAARIYWLLKCKILKTTDRLPKNLFGSVDSFVFSFLKSEQRHSNEITCSRSDCSEKERKYSSIELDIFSTDERIDKFEIETKGVCPMRMKRFEEISEVDAYQKKYAYGRLPIFNYETKTHEYEYGWICNATNIHSLAVFDYGYPPIIIVDIKPLSRRVDEGYQPNPVRLRDLKETIRICSIRYKLRAVINYRNAHFTATLIGPNKDLYIYDDQEGVRLSRTSPDPVETAIYTQIYDF